MTYEEFEAFRQGRNTEADFGTRVTVEYWPLIQFTQYVEPRGPLCMGRKALATIFAPEGHPPEIEDEDPMDEVWLSTDELESLPSWQAFKDDIFAALEAKAAAQAQKRSAADQPPVEA